MKKQPLLTVRWLSLIAIYLTLFVENLGSTIVYPLFAPLFLDPSISDIALQLHPNMRMLFLGIFLAVFPLAQFLFSPPLGAMADRFGKRKILLVTLLLGVIGYFLSAEGIANSNLSWLMLGRFLSGVSASNLAVCFFAFIDFAPTKEKKEHYFSLASAMIGITFVLGPFLGGKLSDSAIAPFFSLAFPMWIAMWLTVISCITVWFAFEEREEEVEQSLVVDLWAEASLRGRSRKEREQKSSYKRGSSPLFSFVVYFVYLFSWYLLIQFFPAYLVEEFHFSVSVIGDAMALMGALWIAGSAGASFYIRLHKRLKPLLLFSTLVYWATLITLVYWQDLVPMTAFASIAVFAAGMIWPLFTSAIAAKARFGSEGKLLGIIQSVQSLAMMLAPIFGGVLIKGSFTPLFALAAFATFIGFALTCIMEE